MADIVDFFGGMGDSERRSEDLQRVEFLSEAIPHIAFHAVYCDEMKKWLDSYQSERIDAGTRATHVKALLTVEALMILTILYKESDYFSDEMVAVSGSEKNFCGVSLTKNSLAGHLQVPNTSGSRSLNAVKRVANAAECFELISILFEHDKKSTLEPTQQLDEVFRKISERIKELGIGNGNA